MQPLPRRKDDMYVWVVCRHYPLPRLLLLVGAPEYAKAFVVWCPRWHWPSGGNDPSPIATLSHAMNHVPWRRGPRRSRCVAPSRWYFEFQHPGTSWIQCRQILLFRFFIFPTRHQLYLLADFGPFSERSFLSFCGLIFTQRLRALSNSCEGIDRCDTPILHTSDRCALATFWSHGYGYYRQMFTDYLIYPKQPG